MWVAPFVNLWSYFLLFSDTVGWAPHLVCFTAPLMRWPSPSCICAASWSCLNLKFVPIKRYLYFSFLINSTIHHFDFFVWLLFFFSCSSVLAVPFCFTLSVDFINLCSGLRRSLMRHGFAGSWGCSSSLRSCLPGPHLLTLQPLLPSFSVGVCWQFFTDHPSKLI